MYTDFRSNISLTPLPDLIKSELSGLAFDSLQQCFRTDDIEAMFAQEPMPPLLNDDIYIVIDPAAGGPGSDYALVAFQRNRGNVTIVGIDVLSGCKEPSKQFKLVEEHVAKLRENLYRSGSKITILVERNLGFEAEHHKRALAHLPNTVFHQDEKAADRVTHIADRIRVPKRTERTLWRCKFCTKAFIDDGHPPRTTLSVKRSGNIGSRSTRRYRGQNSSSSMSTRRP